MQRPNPSADEIPLQDASEQIDCDICVLGAGSGGLSVAAAAAMFGRKVVLIEKHKMGGDCLNYGCVPSKALLAAGKKAHVMRTSGKFGIAPVEPQVDWAAVQDHVRGVIAAIEPNDSVERFTGLGVQVIQAAAHFIDKKTVAAGVHRIRAKHFVIATGSSPAVPPIPGLSDVPYFTNETIFDNRAPIEHLVIVGGGPIGIEMAQAHRRLGANVTVVEAFAALGKDDPEITAVALSALRDEGMQIREHTKVQSVSGRAGAIEVHTESNGTTDVIRGTHLLIATGRKPNIGELRLDAAGIKSERSGIVVDKGLRTANKRVYAIGDCIGGLQFTHVANYHAGIVIRRALFWVPAKVDTRAIPWVTYTDPEIAHVGMTEAMARESGKQVNVLRWPYHENDRAQAEHETSGHVKVVTDKKGRILGASIVGAHAGELIQMWVLAISQGSKVSTMTGFISPYPTLTEINKRAAYRHYATAASNPWVRAYIGLLARFA